MHNWIYRLFGRDKISRYRANYDKKMQKADVESEKFINEVFGTYVDSEEQQKLLEDAKAFHFSSEQIRNIENAFSDYELKNITINVAKDIDDARQHIKQYSRESFFSKISNVVIPKDK